jgi:hypothetical protein
MSTPKKPGGFIMNSIYRVAVLGALMSVISATLGFAQEDNVTIKRTVGDFYEITISGERNGDRAELQLVRTAKNSYRFDSTTLAGYGPSLDIYAQVVPSEDENAKSSYSLTFQEELSGPAWSISYYVSDNYMGFMQGNVGHVKTIYIWDYYPYDSHFNDGYHFDVDLTGSSFEPQPEGAVKIHNLKVEGFEDPFWAVFQWNPGNLELELKEAGQEN